MGSCLLQPILQQMCLYRTAQHGGGAGGVVEGAVFQEVPWSLKMGSRFRRDKRDMEEDFQGL